LSTTGWTKEDKWAAGITVLTLVIMALLAIAAWYSQSVIWLAVSVGALGGLTHEFAQSQGRVLIPKKNQDGIYFGSLSGAVLGVVAGILWVRGVVEGSASIPSLNSFVIEAFLAGLALKGVAEAAATTQVPPTATP
jgi:hypothetical protein